MDQHQSTAQVKRIFSLRHFFLSKISHLEANRSVSVEVVKKTRERGLPARRLPETEAKLGVP